jgi:hypothetical protein
LPLFAAFHIEIVDFHILIGDFHTEIVDFHALNYDFHTLIVDFQTLNGDFHALIHDFHLYSAIYTNNVRSRQRLIEFSRAFQRTVEMSGYLSRQRQLKLSLSTVADATLDFPLSTPCVKTHG